MLGISLKLDTTFCIAVTQRCISWICRTEPGSCGLPSPRTSCFMAAWESSHSWRSGFTETCLDSGVPVDFTEVFLASTAGSSGPSFFLLRPLAECWTGTSCGEP